MPRAPRNKRGVDPVTGETIVVGRAASGEPDLYYDKTSGVGGAQAQTELQASM